MDLGYRNWFHDTVSALAYSFASNQSKTGHSHQGPPYNDLARFVIDQHSRMPDYLRGPLLLATLGFDFLSIFKNGRCFHQLPPDLRKAQIESWKNSKSGFKRDL